MNIVEAHATELFVGTEADPLLQVVGVRVVNATDRAWTADAPATVQVVGQGLMTPAPVLVADLAPGDEASVEVAVAAAPTLRPGDALPAEVHAQVGDRSDRRPLDFSVSQPGWRMFMISHFHYDPVWWNTQSFYTETWEKLPREERPWEGRRQHPAFTLIEAYLDVARRDPDYKFVLAELDYLKPYWDTFPGQRAYLRQLLAEGRLELMGGTYNEANTNLTCAESTIRNAVYGIGYQRDVLGGDPATAWQLDVFGHDPQFPGLMADAGLTSSSWARGPFHQWGPARAPGGNARMQFDSEFDWVAPSGRALLTSYMPNHYSAGWDLDRAATLAEAEQEALELFRQLRAVAGTKNVLLPVGTDYTPPNRWITDIHRDWNARYVWPKFQVALPREFFAAVRDEFAALGGPVPQTRDMNPVYTGKDVSYIDTKQAQRDVENTLLSAEKLATVAALLGARYPAEAFDKAWRQLLFGAHHDGITGTESDQVYLDLLGSWREAGELAREGRDAAADHIAAQIDTRDPSSSSEAVGHTKSSRSEAVGHIAGLAVTVFNTMSWTRTDLVCASLEAPQPWHGLRLRDEHGREVPFVVESAEHDDAGRLVSATLAFIAADVPGVGYRTFWLFPAADLPLDSTWVPLEGERIANADFSVGVDAARGGAIDHLVDRASGKALLKSGELANEVRAYDEYATHPEYGEGPWHLSPLGTHMSQANQAAQVTAERCAIGQRLVVRTGIEAVCDLTQQISLYTAVGRVDCTTTLDGFSGQDTLFRLRTAADVKGGLPLAEVGNAVIGRGFGFPDVDAAEVAYTLDNPAYNWFGIGATARVVLTDAAGTQPHAARAISVAEVVAAGQERGPAVRDLLVALVRKGVTATVSRSAGSRYGAIDVDSNLPDVRIAIGGPEHNPFTEAVLDAAAPGYRSHLRWQVDAHGRGVVWVPARTPLDQVWRPNADLRAPDALPVLIIAGRDEAATAQALGHVIADLDDAVVTVRQPAELDGTTGSVEDYTIAVVNRGIPGCCVDGRGDLYLSLLRSCSGWPSGVWLNPPRRTVPDGSSFQFQHWTHHFDYAIAAGRGDWRQTGMVRAGHDYNNPLQARVVTASGGTLPATGHLVRVGGDAVVLAAMKPAGNPMARMAGTQMDPGGGVTLRCYEPHGYPAEVTVGLFRRLREGFAADLLEQRSEPLAPTDGGVRQRLDGYGIATLTVVPEGGPEPATVPVALGRRREPAQPVYSDYWLHNRGAAPLGYQPVTVQILPRAVAAVGPFQIPVLVASERSDQAVAGRLTIEVPPGWTAEPGERLYRLAPGSHAEFVVTVTPDAEQGRYFVAARIADDAGQTHEDVVTVDLGGAYTAPLAADGAEPARALLVERATRKAVVVDRAMDADTMVALGGELSAELVSDRLDVSYGHPAALEVALRNRVAGAIRGEAQVISPYGTWGAIGPWAQGFAVPGGGEATLRFTARCAADTPATTAWVLVKIGYFGRVLYTRSVALTLVGSRAYARLVSP